MSGERVCIVGAGAAGLVLADRLARHGIPVTLLERGRTPSEAIDDPVRMLGRPHQGTFTARFQAWGGSTTRWGGQLWAWEPYEFESRPALGIDGWPLTHGDLAPYYAVVLDRLRMPRDESRAERVLGPSPLDASIVRRKCSLWLPVTRRNLGATIGAAVRAHPAVEVRESTLALRIVLAPSGSRVRGVEVVDAEGRRELIPAGVVIVAGGAIESTRLLLASSADGTAPGNHSDWLGRAFFDHVGARVARLVPRDPREFARRTAPVLGGGVRYTPRFVVRREVAEREGLLGAYGHIEVPRSEQHILTIARDALRAVQAGRMPRVPLAATLRGIPEAVRFEAVRRLRHRESAEAGAPIFLRVDTEQRPDPESRITLTEQSDRWGRPGVALDWRVSALEERTIRRSAELVAGAFERAGLADVEWLPDPLAREPWDDTVGDTFHMMGGARMSRDAATGVVDPTGRVHGIDNLYLASTAVFPTGGMANPTLTMMALAARLADTLANG